MKLSISMTRRESLLGWSYLLISIFVLPFALVLPNLMLPKPLSETQINLVFMGLNFLAVALIFRKFLTCSVRAAADKPWQLLKAAGAGFLLYYLGSAMIVSLILRISPDFINVNDATVIALFDEHPALMTVATVLLVPITEETLYRGLLFQGFQRKSRVLAYCLSAGIFSAIHVMGYVGQYDMLTLGLMLLQYLPAGIALAWAYEKADTIVAPMLIHIIINLISITALR